MYVHALKGVLGIHDARFLFIDTYNQADIDKEELYLTREVELYKLCWVCASK
jgi:FMN-dependent NADH-azoreductase